MIIDSHVHFDLLEKDLPIADILQKAGESGVARILAIGGSAEANAHAVKRASEHPEVIFPVVGYDRNCATGKLDGAEVNRLASSAAVVGIGETGLDYHYHPNPAPAEETFLRNASSGASAYVACGRSFARSG